MKYNLGQRLTDQYGFSGKVDAIFADYKTAVHCRIIHDGWFEAQQRKPSTKNQIFYSLVEPSGWGTVLVGENEAKEA